MANQKAYDKQTGAEILPGDLIEHSSGETRVFERMRPDGGPGFRAKVAGSPIWPILNGIFPGIEVR